MLKRLNFVMLHVPDVEEATAFYTDKLGLGIDARQPEFVQFSQQGGGAVFAIGKAQTTPQPTETELYELWWYVDNADEAHRELASRGVEIAGPPADQPFGRAFSIKDPAGNTLYLLQPA